MPKFKYIIRCCQSSLFTYTHIMTYIVQFYRVMNMIPNVDKIKKLQTVNTKYRRQLILKYHIKQNT